MTRTMILFFSFVMVAAAAARPPHAVAGEDLDRLFLEMGILPLTPMVAPDDIRFKDLDGRPVWLREFRGRIVFLSFWTTWCPSCRIEMPSMERLKRKLGDRGLVILAVSLQEPAKRVRAFMEQMKLSFAALLDPKGEEGARFGVFSIPTTYLLDRRGAVIGKAVGARQWDTEASLALFRILLEQGTGPEEP